MGILSGIRVADFTRVVAGPYCTMQLSDLGAEVIKVEQPGKGDDSRGWGPPFVEGEGVYYLAINRNKKSVCINLHADDGVELARKLILKSDVVVENFRPGLMDRLGLGYEDLRKDHPGLIYCSISGFGQSGPYRDRSGYDVIVSALGGLLGITGTPGGPPVKTGVAVLDISTGLFAKSSILAALYHRERTGQGQRVEVSLLSTQLAMLINAASGYLVSGEIPSPQGTAHQSVVPYQAFRASDGYILIGAANEKLFRQLCQALEHPEWITDARFKSNADRAVHREELVALIEEALQADTVKGWEKRLMDAQVAVAPVNRMDQVFSDPQVVHSQQVVTVHHPTIGDLPLVGPAVGYSLTPAQVTAPPPRLGEHTHEVLSTLLEVSETALEHLAADGVI